jgi:ATP-dependent Clp protease adaptor protein ClpS
VAIEILSLLVAGAGASYGFWAIQRRRDRGLGLRQLESAFDGDANVVFGVAMHAVTTRGHTAMCPLHLIYGLLQDETFTGAIKKLGGDPDAVETRVLAALDHLTVAQAGENPAGGDVVGHLLSYTYAVAKHHDRKVTIVDLWARLAVLGEAKLLEVPAHELLFLLVHGMPAPPPDLEGRTECHVILRNDDFTTQELVMQILRDVFELSESDAYTRMMQTHTAGKTIVGRYKIAVARDKIVTARIRARAQTMPLWIAPEDC